MGDRMDKIMRPGRDGTAAAPAPSTVGKRTLVEASSAPGGVVQRKPDAPSGVGKQTLAEPSGSLGSVVQRKPDGGDADNPVMASSRPPSLGLGLGDLALDTATLDEFVTDSAALIPAHQQKLDEAARFIKLLVSSGGWLIEVIGYTDAVGTEAHNDALGKQRADAVAKALQARGIEDWRMVTSSKGETELAVKADTANGKNRRVKIRTKPLPLPAMPPMLPGATAPPPSIQLPPNLLPSPGFPGGAPDFSKPNPLPPLPKLDPDWLKRALDNDKLLRELPPFLRDKAKDALSTADEDAADKALDFLPTDDKTKAAVKAAVKALLQTLKGKKWTPPVPPPQQYDQPPSGAPKMDTPPGVIQLPPIKWG
jgi:outer membrane protein OmpA-like peptidoglycan-associated protein